MEASGTRPMDRGGRKISLLCDPCKGENEKQLAVSYCTVCNDYLCNMCKKAHTRGKATKNHSLLVRDKMPQQKPSSDKDSMCPKHSDKALEYYCEIHDEFCCSVCAKIDHKQCNTQYIDDIATDFYKGKEYVALGKAINVLIRLLQETKKSATRNMKDLETKHAYFISDLKDFRTEINNKLDSLEKSAMREIQIEKNSQKETLDSIATRCDSMLSDIHSLSSKLEDLNKYQQEKQLVICCRKAAATVKTCELTANELSKEYKVKDYKFEPDEKIRQFLDSLDSLGHITEIKNHGESNSQTTCPDVSVQTFDQPSSSDVGNIDVQHPTDMGPCVITGGVMVDETKLALVDHSNHSVKVVNVTTNTLVSCIKLPTEPYGVTRVDPDQIVVTRDGRKKGKLVFLKIGKPLSVLEELDINRYCQGVVYSNDTFIVSFGIPKSSVKIFDMKGKVLKLFKTNKAGDDLFSNPVCISLSTDQQTVFVSDSTNNTVTSMTLEGTVQHVYTADSLDGPCGLAVDRNDNVYIAGCRSDNIHQLSTDGNRSQVILDRTSGVVSPWMMTYCKTQHRLYISVESKGCDIVSVNQLHT